MLLREWERDCCLTPTQQLFQLYRDENKLILNNDDVRFVLDQQASVRG